MVRVKAPLMSIGAQKQLGKALIYKQKGSRSFVTGYNKPGGQNPSPASPSQLDQRMLYNLIIAHWQNFSDVEKAVWNDDPRKKSLNISGWNLFLREALRDSLTHLGLAGYWSLNKIVGGKFLDISGNENDGVLKPSYPSNAPILVDSLYTKLGKAGSFDGIDDYVNCGNDLSLNLVNDFTLTVWINKPSFRGTYEQIIAKTDAGGQGGWEFGISRDYIYISSGPITKRGGIISLNTWYYIVVVHDHSAETVKFYLNGAKSGAIGTSITFPAASDSSINVGIGRAADRPNYQFLGTIDDVKVYNRALSAEEIAKHYKSITVK